MESSEATLDLVNLFTLTGLILWMVVFKLCACVLLEGESSHFGAVSLIGSGTTPLTLCTFSLPERCPLDSASSGIEQVKSGTP